MKQAEVTMTVTVNVFCHETCGMDMDEAKTAAATLIADRLKAITKDGGQSSWTLGRQSQFINVEFRGCHNVQGAETPAN